MKYKIISYLCENELESLVGDNEWDEVYSLTFGEGRGRTEIDVYKVGDIYIKRLQDYGMFDFSIKYYHVEPST